MFSSSAPTLSHITKVVVYSNYSFSASKKVSNPRFLLAENDMFITGIWTYKCQII